MARLLINRNLAPNGDLSAVPTFVAATSTTNRWIDGTAAGSALDSVGLQYRWHLSVPSVGGTITAKYDTVNTYNGKLSLQLTTSQATTLGSINGVPITLGTSAGPLSSVQRQFFVPCLPSTQYKLSAYVKTGAISNLNGGGARIRLVGYNGTSTSSTVSASSSYMNGTSDFTLVEVLITTTATTSYLNIWLQIDGETGTAWFSNIDLRPTTPTTRNARISPKALAAARKVVRDFGTALSFPGTAAFVNLGATSILNYTSNFTFSAWVLQSSRTQAYIFTKGRGGASGFSIYVGASGLVSFSKLGVVAIAGAYTLPVGRYVHLTVVINSNSTVNIYADGNLVDTISNAAALIQPTHAAYIGCSIDSGGAASMYWNGRIDSVSTYSIALSASDVRYLFTSSICQYAPSGYWALNEGSGTTAIDSSGNGNNGTITGATYSTDVPSASRIRA